MCSVCEHVRINEFVMFCFSFASLMKQGILAGIGSMENVCKTSKENQQLKLPTGFRFHPTDEELIKHYLTKKVVDNCFCAVAIGEADLNKCEPWNLPGESIILIFY